MDDAVLEDLYEKDAAETMPESVAIVETPNAAEETVPDAAPDAAPATAPVVAPAAAPDPAPDPAIDGAVTSTDDKAPSLGIQIAHVESISVDDDIFKCTEDIESASCSPKSSSSSPGGGSSGGHDGSGSGDAMDTSKRRRKSTHVTKDVNIEFQNADTSSDSSSAQVIKFQLSPWTIINKFSIFFRYRLRWIKCCKIIQNHPLEHHRSRIVRCSPELKMSNK